MKHTGRVMDSQSLTPNSGSEKEGLTYWRRIGRLRVDCLGVQTKQAEVKGTWGVSFPQIHLPGADLLLSVTMKYFYSLCVKWPQSHLFTLPCCCGLGVVCPSEGPVPVGLVFRVVGGPLRGGAFVRSLGPCSQKRLWDQLIIRVSITQIILWLSALRYDFPLSTSSFHMP